MQVAKIPLIPCGPAPYASSTSQIKTLLNRICLDNRAPLMRQKRHHDCTVVIKTPLNGAAVLQIKTLSLGRNLTSIKLKLISTAHSVTVWLGSSPDDRALAL
jgi:hypothetical protein